MVLWLKGLGVGFATGAVTMSIVMFWSYRADFAEPAVAAPVALERAGASAPQVARATLAQSRQSPPPSVLFHARALAGPPFTMTIASPSPPALDPTTEFTRTVVARVYDNFRNPVPGARRRLRSHRA